MTKVRNCPALQVKGFPSASSSNVFTSAVSPRTEVTRTSRNRSLDDVTVENGSMVKNTNSRHGTGYSYELDIR